MGWTSSLRDQKRLHLQVSSPLWPQMHPKISRSTLLGCSLTQWISSNASPKKNLLSELTVMLVWRSEELPKMFRSVELLMLFGSVKNCQWISPKTSFGWAYDVIWLPWRIAVLSGSEEAGIMVRFSSKFLMLCGLVASFRCIHKHHLLVELARMLFGSVKNCQRCFFQLRLWCCMGQRRIADTIKKSQLIKKNCHASAS